MLVLVIAALVLSAIVPLRAFFTQRADLASLRAETAQQQQRVAALKAAKQKWTDSAYVEAQARARLHFVMPGEIGYVVLGPDEAPAPTAKQSVQADDQAWFSTLWGSVQEADATDAVDTHTPSDR